MKTWTYTRALRWLAIEPETRRIDIYLAPGDLYKTNMRLKDISFHQLRDQYELGYFYRPPTDPVPLAEVLYELVSGEEEEFEVRFSRENAFYDRVKFEESHFSMRQRENTHQWDEVRNWGSLATFHRIAEPEEKKNREPRELWGVVNVRGLFYPSLCR